MSGDCSAGSFFAIVFTLDLLKGLLPTLAAGLLLRHLGTVDQTGYIVWLLVGFAAILGHMFSVILKFQGGKGVATSCGVLFGVFPYFTLAGVIAVLVWGVLFKVTCYVSVASIFGSLAFPVAYAVVVNFPAGIRSANNFRCCFSPRSSRS